MINNKLKVDTEKKKRSDPFPITFQQPIRAVLQEFILNSTYAEQN